MGKIAVWMAGAALGSATLTSIASAQTMHRDATEMPEVQPHEAPLPEDPEYVQRTRWYGWQTLAADAASLSVFVGSQAMEHSRDEPARSMQVIGTIGYLAASPMIHLAGHGSVDKAFGSLALRVFSPLVGMGAGVLVVPGGDPMAGVALGFLTGVVGAITVDAAFLANERRPRDEGSAFGLAPMLDAAARPAGMSLRGAF